MERAEEGMSFVHVTVERGFGRLELDRPPLNVIDLAAAAELEAAARELAARNDVAVIELSARGRAFSAGVDVRDHLPDRGAEMLRAFHRACFALLRAPQPLLTVVQGAALGGGCELTLVCDLVIASRAATFGLPEIRLGVFPPLAAACLPRMIPAHLAAELLLGRTVDADEALRWGLVNRVAEAGSLAAAAREVRESLLASSPSSLRLAKAAMARSRVRPTEEEVEAAEAFYVERLMNTPDAIEGLQAFLEKRAPRWSGPAS
jgi:cyclohexa-1,5-dienecarbonyl-CoA hydratase